MAKGLLSLALVGAAMALLGALWAGARHRGLMAHCRNNLRQAGLLAASNRPVLDPSRTGRDFWQNVREVRYRNVQGRWSPPPVDPFVCPVYGKTLSRLEDKTAIDYRGPRTPDVRPGRTPLGADRPGNHPDGGHVLFLDLSVAKMDPEVRSAGSGDPDWESAGRSLSD